MTTHAIAATAGWSGVVRAGQTMRIVDLHGQQAVDTLFYALADAGERYSAQDTLRVQGSAYVDVGTRLMSNRGRVLAVVVGNTAGPHDTSAGACSCESNTVRFGHQTRFQHACRENFVLQAALHGLSKRDIVPNLNFFMNVPIAPDGALVIADGIGAPGSHVELRAEIDLLCLISNCPQINNPCNGFDPSPIEVSIE
jgi:urea carboxylase-associated protein 1